MDTTAAADAGSRSAYGAAIGVFDEHVDPTGSLRTAWQPAMRGLQELGAHAIRHRRAAAERLVTATGAAHTLAEPDDPSGRSRIDLLPYVLGGADWTELQAGLMQRVRLHDAVLTDLYGDRTLVAAAIVPAEVVFGSIDYEPAAHGWEPVGPRLSRYAAEVVRDSTGRFVIVAEHTDAAAGAGRALLGRSILARSVPELYGPDAESLASFFDTFRTTVAGMAPASASNPRAVLLAPPTKDPTYVEHAYLVAQLGYTLVTAADLAVQRGRVFLRAIGGLEPVDVVIRAVGIGDTDSLETSRFGTGVAGLVQAAREACVGVSNTIGSGLAASAALSPYLEAVCRHLLGEPLLLHSVPAFWCADRDVVAQVQSEPDVFELIEAMGTSSDPRDSHNLMARFAKDPDRFVARRRVQHASVPVIDPDGSIVPGWATLAMHATFDGHTVSVLPGGTATSAALGLSPMSKDVVVMANERSARQRVTVASPIDLRSSLPSRAAEALFWVGRNAERAESVARGVQTVLVALAHDPTLADDGEWTERAIRFLGAASGRDKTVVGIDGHDLDVAVADALSGRNGALADSLNHLVIDTFGVREYLSATAWRVTAALDTHRLALATADESVRIADTLDRVLMSLAALAGLAQESVVRGPGWQFLDLGRRWERAHLLMSGLGSALGDAPSSSAVGSVGELVLAANECLVAYRRRYRTDVEELALFELLIADDANPRSLAFQAARLAADLGNLPERPGADRCRHLTDDLARLVGRDVTLATLIGVSADVVKVLSDLERAIVGCWFASVVPREQSASGAS
jgi:uncharacterized circularly permuted ATP-grasp superfamily protein/uncharacterized alpha-E superfamily protein